MIRWHNNNQIKNKDTFHDDGAEEGDEDDNEEDGDNDEKNDDDDDDNFPQQTSQRVLGGVNRDHQWCRRAEKEFFLR